MKKTSGSNLNERERETKWKRERHRLTFGLQRASRDARELNMQLMTLKATSPEVITKIDRVEVESDTCKLALEKFSAESRSESEGDEVSAIATDGARKQMPGCGAETDEGNGTSCGYSASL